MENIGSNIWHVVRIVFRIVGILGLIAAAFSFYAFKDEFLALKSLREIDDSVFYIEYEGDYNFEEYLKSGGGKTNEEMAAYISKCLKRGSWRGSGKAKGQEIKITPPAFGCASIAAENKKGGYIFGRNYDWQDSSVMIVHSKPANGYESISTSCLEFLGLDRKWKPSYKFPADMVALATIYIPLDGLNEKGLYIADLVAGDKEATAQASGKPDLTTTAAIRMILDKAANVDEAVSLLEQIDMNSVIGYAHHFAIADANGRSVVVEYVNNKMYVSETPVLTNHYTAESPKKGAVEESGRENSYTRFDELLTKGKKAGWSMDSTQVRDSLENITAAKYSSEEMSVWSAVFESDYKRATYYFRGDYSKPFVIEF